MSVHGERMLGVDEVRPAVLLFAALGSAVAWAIHFCAVYFIDTLFCTEGWSGGDATIYLVTVPLAAVSASAGLLARRTLRRTDEAPPNGSPANGVASNGVPSNEVPSNEVPPNGVAPNEVASNEVASNGVAPNGVAPNEAAVARVGAERVLLRLGEPAALLFTLLIVAEAFAPAFVSSCAVAP